MSTVYFVDLTARSNKDSILVKTTKLLEQLYKDQPFFKEKDIIGIKTHFGESGLATFLSPIYSRVIIQKLKEMNTLPFLFDTSTLYTSGLRTNAVTHIATAIKNGFSYATTDAPIIIADGLKGSNYIEVKVEGSHFKTVKIASDIQYMDAVVCLSHFKGHCAAGFGGSLKAISMGMAARAGKLEMHSATKPFITAKCSGCGICITICPAEAIEVQNGKANIKPDLCIGCMRCDTKCPKGAIKFNWDSPESILMEKMAEYAKGTSNLKKGKIAYLNFLVNITPDCDCYGFSNPSIVRDIGVLASFDPVAIDEASIDLVKETAGEDILKKIWPNADYAHLFSCAEKLGIGTRKYKLVTAKGGN
jgi:uncharacterized Fe-S center protein